MKIKKRADFKKSPLINSGHTACAGCGATIAMNLASQKFLAHSVLVIPACCWSVIAGPYPLRTLNVPAMHTAFASAAATATGIYHALKVKEEKPFRVIAWAGDGGTFDIGLQSLSGALERNTPFTYICYDNEAYMNTGVQRSSATPQFASTTTTPEPQVKTQVKKDFMDIVAAHAIPYAASASIAYPADLQQKVEKAMKVNGASVLHIFSPCPTGQGFAEKNTVKIARLAVETGIFPLYELENGTLTINYEPTFERIEEYLNLQSRFKMAQEAEQEEIKSNILNKWKILKKKVQLFS